MEKLFDHFQKMVIGFAVAFILAIVGIPAYNTLIDMNKKYIDPDSAEINQLVSNIKEKYGKTVYVGIDPCVFNKVPNLYKRQLSIAVNEDDAILLLEKLEKVLDKYNSKALESFADEFYIVQTIEWNGEQYSGFYEYNLGRDYILFAADEADGTRPIEITMDHEIFHGLTTETISIFHKKSKLPDGFEKAFRYGEDCVSYYAETSELEELAETWAYSLHLPHGVAEYKYELMKEYFMDEYLK